MTRRRYPLMILINQSRNHIHVYPLINRLSTRHPWQSRRVTRVKGSIGRYYNNNRHSPDFERLLNHAKSAYFRLFLGYFEGYISHPPPPFGSRPPPFTYPGSAPALELVLFRLMTEPAKHTCSYNSNNR